ncbi:MAG: ABC transporter ATP-binding protein [Thermodesulfobacteriota bacterium]
MLDISHLHAFYEESHILKGISLQVKEGELTTLLGRNGAGKTTTMKSIMGLIIPKEGNILFDGKNIIGLKPHEIARLGIGLVPEDRRIFPSLTVLENLNLPVIRKRGEGWNLKKIYEYFPRLEERQGHKGFELSGGEQQMLSIARILRTKASLILLDEPTEGLAPLFVQSIESILQGVKKDGITMLLVEQNTRFAERVGERHYIISNGEIVYMGNHERFIVDEEVKKRYLGV